MSPEGKYGLGHLRYQEHLTARELQKRGINIISLLSQEWWYGPLILFARMTENIEWLIHEAGKQKKASLPIIKMIINTRNKIERENLLDLVEKYCFFENKQGYYNHIYKDITEYYEEFDDD
jgi:hypothetical protein